MYCWMVVGGKAALLLVREMPNCSLLGMMQVRLAAAAVAEQR